jgi:hypothetical protein
VSLQLEAAAAALRVVCDEAKSDSMGLRVIRNFPEQEQMKQLKGSKSKNQHQDG